MNKKDKLTIKYFDLVLLSDKKDSLFDIYDCLVPKYINCDTSEQRKYFHDLKSDIIDFGKYEKYFNQFNNDFLELTEKGKAAKTKGGHLKYLKSQKKYWFTKYQIIYLPFFTIFGCFGIYTQISDRSLKSECQFLNQKYDSLNTEFQNLYQQYDSLLIKTTVQPMQNLNDSSQTKSLND